jgi:hypothetical protein
LVSVAATHQKREHHPLLRCLARAWASEGPGLLAAWGTWPLFVETGQGAVQMSTAQLDSELHLSFGEIFEEIHSNKI